MLVISPMNLEAPHLRHPRSDGESTSSVTPATVQMVTTTTTVTSSVKHNTSITKRPRLSLQTSSLPISCGKSTTGLSWACATASPTVLNTFNNAYEISRPLSSTDIPSPSKSSNKLSRYAFGRSDSTAPYQQPLGVRSILRNSPLAKSSSSSLRRPSMSMTASGVPESRHVYFPAKKQVSYRFPLEEEIRTVRFVARHSDLSSDSESELESEESESDGSESSVSDKSSSGDDDDEGKPEAAESSPQQRKRRKSIPSERQIRAAALRDGLEGDSYTYTWSESTPTTPQRSRRKRRCKWRWTLGDPVAAALGQDESSVETSETSSTLSESV
ncbi:hypothetical protein VTN77DRAFT_8934 [Rasamsonia byssochlamydoides]|uniref:uncharacterized protein n=1 Tax=Rasamsonia byssochlamydoides TaxID=89139 RepID=UPI00374314B0